MSRPPKKRPQSAPQQSTHTGVTGWTEPTAPGTVTGLCGGMVISIQAGTGRRYLSPMHFLFLPQSEIP
jgi:hypothetical protein